MSNFINIIGGEEGSPETEAAKTLRDKIQEEWKAFSDQVEITLIVGVQCHGQRVRDIDLVLILNAKRDIELEPLLYRKDKYDRTINSKKLIVRSLCLVIEVKDHDPRWVRFEGNQLYVRYGGGEHNATTQSEAQQVSLRNFLRFHRLESPFVTNLIWLRNIKPNQLPDRPHNFIGGDSTWELFVNVAAQLGQFRENGNMLLDAFSKVSFNPVRDLLTRRIEPSALDRVRMERIVKNVIRDQLAIPTDKRLFILRGRGGTGKTVALLQLAWQAYDQEGKRCLLLTYNRVLAADLKRLLTLLKVPDDVATHSIQVYTIVGYMLDFMKDLGIDIDISNFNSSYTEAKNLALDYLKGGGLTEEELKTLQTDQPNRYDFDLIFVDEGQDWPDDEIQLLSDLFPSEETFIVADGVDQFVRTNAESANWRRIGAPETIPLSLSLRMKTGMTLFANLLAQELGLEWALEILRELTGGRVEIIIGDYLASGRHEQHLQTSRQEGNKLIDNLLCVPPCDVYEDEEGERQAYTADRLADMGFSIWNGVSGDQRLIYPTSLDQLRIVQYDSCRGAEGWLVIAFSLDKFADFKAKSWKNNINNPLSDPEQEQKQFVARWLMIALTRALDTLVIELSQEEHWLTQAILNVAEKFPDVVTVYRSLK